MINNSHEMTTERQRKRVDNKLKNDVINTLNLLETNLSTIIATDNLIYLSSCKGMLFNKAVEAFFPSFFVIIKTNKNIFLHKANEKLSEELPAGLYLLKNHKDIMLTKDAQLLIVSECFYERFSINPALCKEINQFSNETIFRALFEQLKISQIPDAIMLTLAELTFFAEPKEIIRNDFNHICDVIKDNYKNPRCNLDTICVKLHMSRRKIQYILQRNSITFIDLIQSHRINELKKQIERTPYTPLVKLVESCGFRNLGMAKRTFSKSEGTSLSEFQKAHRVE